MNRILYNARCRCKEEAFKEGKSKKKTRSQGNNVLLYPDEFDCQTFQIKYEKKLSPVAKFILNSFQQKYIYYAIDDILDLFQSNPTERDNMLAILYSPILSLQNNLSINFFDIWIQEISINEVSKVNKFLTNDSLNLKPLNFQQSSDITMILRYKLPVLPKGRESLW